MPGIAVGSSRRRCVATLLVSALSLFAATPAPRAAGGAWFEMPPPESQRYGSAVYDRNRHRMILFGGFTGITEGNDVWVLELAGPNHWRRLQPTGTPPSIRRSHSAVYDPIQDRMIVFGGGIIVDHTWVLNNEVWALELGGTPHWSAISPTGTPPIARFAGVAVFDATRNRMLLHGGARSDGSTIGDLWRLELSGTPAWVQVSATTTIGPRAFASAVIDSARDRMLVMGGIRDFSSLADTWAYPLAGGSWSQLATAGSGPRTLSHSAVFDPVHDQMVVFGGQDIATGDFLLGAWCLAFGTPTPTWSRVPNTGAFPPPLEGAAAIHDPIAGEVRIFGGWGGLSAMSSINQNVWTLSLRPSPSWSAPLPANAPPAAGRTGASVAYDSRNQRMFMTGGWRNDIGGPGTAADVWVLDLTSGTPSWTPITPAGTPPAGRAFASLVYDPSDHRLILYGGENQGSRHSDVWSLSLDGSPAWTQLVPTGEPPAGRSRHGAIYDSVRDRMVVFGGSPAGFPNSGNDVWTLSLSGAPAWTQLSPAGTPPSRRHGMGVALDAAHDRMIVFGGLSDLPPAFSQDVWALSLAGSTAWDSIEVAAGPAARHSHTAVVDPARDRLLVFGGYTDGGSGPLASNDLWALTLSGSPLWNPLQPAEPSPRPDAGHSAIYDVTVDRMVTYSGVGGLNRTWIHQPVFALATPPPSMPVAGGRFRASPNPSRGPLDVSFTLARAGRARVILYDLSGRRVARLVDTMLPAGNHNARWDGCVGGRPAPAGVYLARFDHPAGVATLRIVRLR